MDEIVHWVDAPQVRLDPDATWLGQRPTSLVCEAT